MKSLSIVILLFVVGQVWATLDTRYLEAMQTAIASINSSTTMEQYQQVANKLERISASETKEWLPSYWGAYCYTTMASLENDNDRKDQLLDKAELFLKKADALQSRNDELEVLRTLYIQARLSVDPYVRYVTYGSLMNESFRKAKEINPNNPRLYLLQGRTTYATPEALGGGKKNGCEIINRSIKAFDTFKPLSSIHPDWGRKEAHELFLKCN